MFPLQATYDKLHKEVPGYKLISTSVVSDRMKINGSLARRAIRDLAQAGKIKCIAHHGGQYIYTRAVIAEEAPAPAADKSKGKGKKK